MLIIDEYLAVRVLVGAWPSPLPEDETLALPAYRHYRLLQRVHQPGSGQLSALLADSAGTLVSLARLYMLGERSAP